MKRDSIDERHDGGCVHPRRQFLAGLAAAGVALTSCGSGQPRAWMSLLGQARKAMPDMPCQSDARKMPQGAYDVAEMSFAVGARSESTTLSKLR
ncbi:MAG: twin-arginine translocation signal domain-containing protein [Betaproteobacteria bacterium]|nr:twin-arginine translocation signal domain-containing protein [Betaproteobacteria bacterium]